MKINIILDGMTVPLVLARALNDNRYLPITENICTYLKIKTMMTDYNTYLAVSFYRNKRNGTVPILDFAVKFFICRHRQHCSVHNSAVTVFCVFTANVPRTEIFSFNTSCHLIFNHLMPH